MPDSSQPRPQYFHKRLRRLAVAGRNVGQGSRVWEAEILSLAFRPKMYAGGSWVGHRKRTALSLRVELWKMGPADSGRKFVDEVWMTKFR